MSESRLANDGINIVIAWLSTSSHNDFVDVSCSASVNFVFIWDVAGITWEILFLVVDISHC